MISYPFFVLEVLDSAEKKKQDPEDEEEEGTSSIAPMDAAWAAAFAAVPEATALQASGHLDFRKYRGGLYRCTLLLSWS